jgi:hypothetical protein
MHMVDGLADEDAITALGCVIVTAMLNVQPFASVS